MVKVLREDDQGEATGSHLVHGSHGGVLDPIFDWLTSLVGKSVTGQSPFFGRTAQKVFQTFQDLPMQPLKSYEAMPKTLHAIWNLSFITPLSHFSSSLDSTVVSTRAFLSLQDVTLFALRHLGKPCPRCTAYEQP